MNDSNETVVPSQGLVVFSSPTCSPCSILKHMLEESGVPFTPIDIKENPDVVSRFGLRSVPVTMYLESGVSKWTKVGQFNISDMPVNVIKGIVK